MLTSTLLIGSIRPIPFQFGRLISSHSANPSCLNLSSSSGPVGAGFGVGVGLGWGVGLDEEALDVEATGAGVDDGTALRDGTLRGGIPE